MAYRRLREHVGLFRGYLKEQAGTMEGQDLLAAKLMGRWRSGAPLVLAPERDDPELGADPLRNNDFNYKEMGGQDGTLEYKIPKRPIRKLLKGLPAFTTLTGGAYFFLPGLNGLRYLAALS